MESHRVLGRGGITDKFNYFIECENLSRESKANFIMDTLTKAELNIEHLRG